jgi:F420-dependent oxidoreductase-like protein
VARDLKLAYSIGYWSAGPPAGVAEAVAEADRLGFDSIWTAEAYGSDVLTPLAWWGASTSRVKLGTAIMQMSARTPAAAAMAAMTLDHLSGGRFLLGLGVSGPQVVEGWYGQSFAKPLARTREYIALVRDIVGRHERVTAPGPHYPLPYPDGTGLGKPLKSTLHPLREDIPIYLGAEGPKNVSLAGELCDGWLALFFSPQHQSFYRDALAEGFGRDGARRSAEDFEVVASAPLIVHDDLEQAADLLRPMYALYFGGMGARQANFHHDVAVRMGYEAEAKRIQDLYLEGRKDDAAAAVPTKMVEELALIGPPDKVRHDLQAWRESIVTTLSIGGGVDQVRQAAELVLG